MTDQLFFHPTIAVLPSGRAVTIDNLLDARYNPDNETLSLRYFGELLPVEIDDRADVAAMRALIHRLGESADAPTLAGEDADGDGTVGES